MNERTRTAVIVFLAIAVIVVCALVRMRARVVSPAPAVEGKPVNVVSYVCGHGETVSAAYYAGEALPPAAPDQPPVPGGRIVLTFADGSVLPLQQVISADGGRYANADESVVFWDKGNGAMFTKAGAQTPESCVLLASDPGGLPGAYATSTGGFSVRYPAGYAVDDSYTYQALGPGKDIMGTKFTISAATATGTNLGADSYLSVESLPRAKSCIADLFLGDGASAHEVTEGDMTYSFASSTGAGAGNHYEETVYALPGINSCTAVRYFVHYSVFENYPPGMVKEFNRAAILAQFNAIRHTLRVAP